MPPRCLNVRPVDTDDARRARANVAVTNRGFAYARSGATALPDYSRLVPVSISPGQLADIVITSQFLPPESHRRRVSLDANLAPQAVVDRKLAGQ